MKARAARLSVAAAFGAFYLLSAHAAPASAQEVTCNGVPVEPGDACGGGLPGQQYDSDWDGASDSTESLYGTNPYNPDTDGDGLRDGDEYSDRYGRADPTMYDTDYDGLGDGYEVFQNNSDPQLYDTDGDGRSDANDAAPRDPFR